MILEASPPASGDFSGGGAGRRGDHRIDRWIGVDGVDQVGAGRGQGLAAGQGDLRRQGVDRHRELVARVSSADAQGGLSIDTA